MNSFFDVFRLAAPLVIFLFLLVALWFVHKRRFLGNSEFVVSLGFIGVTIRVKKKSLYEGILTVMAVAAILYSFLRTCMKSQIIQA